ncbi:MAG TPA: Hsp70 family protein [Thermoflexia bacterium]|nr:Hsp70 family protein [Thermoflexia bacterium]
MHLGIDFGTTNSSVAHFDGRELLPIQLESGNENRTLLPSLIYVKRNHQILLGNQAAAAYLQEETGRKPEWERRLMGAIEIIVAGAGSSPIQYMHDIYDLVDIAAHGRLLQSVKTVLRDPQYEGTNIFDRYYPVDELIAMLLSALKRRAEAQLGESCAQVVLGRPVSFSADPAVSVRAEEILYRAALFAGFEEISFQLEPIAAAHLYHRSSDRREIALIFDFGGGTLDLTVAEVGTTRPPRVLGSRGVLVGGDDLDRQIMKSLLPHFGAGSEIEPEIEFPYDMLEQLESWQTMPYLSRPQPLGKIMEYQRTSNNPQAMHALETLVTQNVGFALFKIIERSKKQLSGKFFAPLNFIHQEIRIHERLLRRDFETLISDEVAAVEREIQLLLAETGVRPAQVEAVLRTGGSSLVPAFVTLLRGIFGAPVIRALDPLTSVGGGLAIVAHERSGRPPSAYAKHYTDVITELQVSSSRRYEKIILRSHRQSYTDRDYTLVKLPLRLSGLHAIKTADRDYVSTAEDLLRFQLTQPAQVYVIYHAKADTLPHWLRPFERLPGELVEINSIGGRMPFFVYRRAYPAGPVTLGGARAAGYRGTVFMNYLVAVQPE